MEQDDPYDPDSADAAAADAAASSGQPVGQSVHPCNNWIDVIAYDEATDEPIADLPYKVFDVPTGDEVAAGTTDGSDVPQSHCIDDEYTELVVFFGQDAAIDEARENIEQMQRDRQLAAQHLAAWNGIPAGLAREEFEASYVNLIRSTGRLIPPRIGILEMSWYGWGGIFDHIFGGADYAQEEFVRLNIRLCWEEYQLVTGGRDATRGESFGGGAGNGLTFGFGEEFASYLDSIMLSDKTYSEILAERRRIQDIERISHPNYFLGGEIPPSLSPLGARRPRARARPPQPPARLCAARPIRRQRGLRWVPSKAMATPAAMRSHGCTPHCGRGLLRPSAALSLPVLACWSCGRYRAVWPWHGWPHADHGGNPQSKISSHGSAPGLKTTPCAKPMNRPCRTGSAPSPHRPPTT